MLAESTWVLSYMGSFISNVSCLINKGLSVVYDQGRIQTGGARNSNHAQSTREIFRPRPQNGQNRVQMAAERPVFGIIFFFMYFCSQFHDRS